MILYILKDEDINIEELLSLDLSDIEFKKSALANYLRKKISKKRLNSFDDFLKKIEEKQHILQKSKFKVKTIRH